MTSRICLLRLSSIPRNGMAAEVGNFVTFVITGPAIIKNH